MSRFVPIWLFIVVTVVTYTTATLLFEVHDNIMGINLDWEESIVSAELIETRYIGEETGVKDAINGILVPTKSGDSITYMPTIMDGVKAETKEEKFLVSYGKKTMK